VAGEYRSEHLDSINRASYCYTGGPDNPLGAVEKATMVLESFPPGRTAIGVSELARRCGFAKSTTHRILQILEAVGMVERLTNGYRLGHRLRELADIAGGRAPSQFRDCVLPHLLDLYEETHLAIHLGVWSGGEVLIVENLYGRNTVYVPPHVGTRAPLHCTALGKVLLAHADERSQRRVLEENLRAFTRETITSPLRLEHELQSVRRDGIAFSWSEFLPGIANVAVPIWGPGRTVTAAISVAGPEDRLDVAAASRHIRRVAHAASLSQCAGGKTA
jgi:DNA-binding IclR family transcriptional regulator